MGVFQKLQKSLGEDLANKEYEVPMANDKRAAAEDDSDIEADGADANTDAAHGDHSNWAISDDDSEDSDDGGGGVYVKKRTTKGKKRKLEASASASAEEKKRKLKQRKLNPEDEKRLEEELTVLLTKILKKFPAGLTMVELWRKITASLAVDAAVLKKVLPRVLKALARKKEASDGIKKYCYKK